MDVHRDLRALNAGAVATDKGDAKFALLEVVLVLLLEENLANIDCIFGTWPFHPDARYGRSSDGSGSSGSSRSSVKRLAGAEEFEKEAGSGVPAPSIRLICPECLAVQDGARFSRPKLPLFVTWAATTSTSPTPWISLMPAEGADQGSAKPFLGMQAPTLTAPESTAQCPVAPITFAETGLRMPWCRDGAVVRLERERPHRSRQRET